MRLLKDVERQGTDDMPSLSSQQPTSTNKYADSVLTFAVLLASTLLVPHSTTAGEGWFRSILERDPEEDPFEERIETDRHDFTQSSRTVGRGVVQTELGYSYFYKDTEEELENAHTTPEMMVRVGLTDRLEFRTRWNYAWQFRNSEEEHHDSNGAEDLRFSIKYELCEGKGWIPEGALRLGWTAPSGGSAFTTGRVEPSIDYIFTYELAERVYLSGSAGVSSNGAGDFSLAGEGGEATGDFQAWSQSLALGLPVTERSELYVEWYGIFSNGADDEFSLSFFNIGVDYYLTKNIVADFRVGKGLTTDSDDFFGGIGGGFRF